MPKIRELITLVDYRNFNASIDQTVFPGAQAGSYWATTRTPHVFNSSWLVDFYEGNTNVSSQNSSMYVRCVRFQQECFGNIDCSGGDTPYCVNNVCVQCSQDSNCFGLTPYCSKGVCVRCVDNSGCLGSTPYCVNATCTECWEGISGRQCWNMFGHVGCCPVNTFCSPPEIEQRQCVECLVTQDCKRNSRPFCDNTTYSCVKECKQDGECNDAYQTRGTKCKNGECFGTFLGEDNCQ